ncbi:hypothetical protein ASE63_25265 [Bosea sp. Root381]|uniref:hypothetical protein n=1 Tax=Bosea sp. Root381 TaxID=1736524 RepID=UPI0006FB0557|nr:hypothetical protein [Bosea sp. Root381]KRE04924.1 hypothetical protein ASE63_25265 [Bosea sp. Root381]
MSGIVVTTIIVIIAGIAVGTAGRFAVCTGIDLGGGSAVVIGSDVKGVVLNAPPLFLSRR